MNAERTRNTRARAAARALLCAPLVLLAGLAPARAQSGRPRQVQQVQPQQQPRQSQQQQPQQSRGSRSSSLSVELPTPVAETPVPFEGGARGGRLDTLSFTTPDANFERAVVKNAPFTAEAVTEHAQTLADGNRMTRKSAARLFRDSAGRTRREHTLTRGSSGVLAPDGEPPRLIVINDPVGQVNYQIDTRTMSARRMEIPPGLREARERALGGNAPFSVLMPTSAAHRRTAGEEGAGLPEPRREKLEPQTVEGVLAEGTRTSVMIPAGEFDNEQPLEITHEEWYSPELKMVVLMRHNDPRFGETTFRLTNVSRGEPDRTLFAPPDGVRIVSRPGPLDGPRRTPPRGTPVPLPPHRRP
jgi:hypothetical protein